MKTLVIGTGIIGTAWGWALSNAGIDVTHFVRPSKKDDCKNGVTLDVRDGRKGHKRDNVVQYDLKCVDTITPSDPYEIIIVPVNFDQVDAVLDQLVPLSGDAIFLIFGANWYGLEGIEKRLPRERYLMGFPRGGGTQRDGIYTVSLEANVVLGEADGGRTEKLQRVESLFAQADIQAEMTENILHLLWTSHAVAVGFGAGLGKSGDIDVFLRDRAAVILAYNVTKEIFGLCRKRGVDPYKAAPHTDIYKLPPWLFVLAIQFLAAIDPGLKRVLARLIQTANEKELRAAMLKTAEEFKFDMPLLAAAGADL